MSKEKDIAKIRKALLFFCLWGLVNQTVQVGTYIIFYFMGIVNSREIHAYMSEKVNY
jgi:hypothetical protein